MTREVTRMRLASVANAIESVTGWHYPAERLDDLEGKLRTAASELGHRDLGEFLDWIMRSHDDPDTIRLLARYLTVSETYFMRDPATFEALERHVLPELIERRRADGGPLRLWSAGCSDGAEAYSIAIAVRRLLPVPGLMDVAIVGTDINADVITRAKKGIYRPWSLRGTSDEFVMRHFTPGSNECVQIDPALRDMVRFRELNLLDEHYPLEVTGGNAVDCAFCRHVLIYLSQETQRRIIDHIWESLVPGGYLFVAPSELAVDALQRFEHVMFDGVTALRRPSERTRVATSRRLTEPRRPAPVYDPSAPTREPEPVDAVAHAQIADHREGPGHDALKHEDFDLVLHLADSGELNDALEQCQRLMARDPFDPQAHYLAATVLTELGRLDEAAAALRKTLYLDPDSILGHFLAGIIARRTNRSDAANRHLQQALELLRNVPEGASVPGSRDTTAQELASAVSSMMQSGGAR